MLAIIALHVFHFLVAFSNFQPSLFVVVLQSIKFFYVTWPVRIRAFMALRNFLSLLLLLITFKSSPSLFVVVLKSIYFFCVRGHGQSWLSTAFCPLLDLRKWFILYHLFPPALSSRPYNSLFTSKCLVNAKFSKLSFLFSTTKHYFFTWSTSLDVHLHQRWIIAARSVGWRICRTTRNANCHLKYCRYFWNILFREWED